MKPTTPACTYSGSCALDCPLSEAGALRCQLFKRRKPSRLGQMARDALPGVLAALLLTLIYALVQTIEDNRELRRVAAVKAAMVCPDRLGSLVFAHSGFTKVDVARPGLARLSCYYSRGVRG